MGQFGANLRRCQVPPSLQALARSYRRPTPEFPTRIALAAVGVTTACVVAAHVYRRSHSATRAAEMGLVSVLLPGV